MSCSVVSTRRIVSSFVWVLWYRSCGVSFFVVIDIPFQKDRAGFPALWMSLLRTCDIGVNYFLQLGGGVSLIRILFKDSEQVIRHSLLDILAFVFSRHLLPPFLIILYHRYIPMSIAFRMIFRIKSTR
nr:MAG TPA: hypothetical protein [Caudoviricetes sp.]